MYAPITSSALFERLATLGRPDLLAKVNELRGRLELYLRGVNQTFAHYTSHAIDHGDAIVRQLSSLVYEDQTRQRTITLDLNATETYLILLAAYLHDAGMVVTDDEKFNILGSDSWRDFAATHQEPANDIQKLQSGLSGDETFSDPQTLFLAGLEQRLYLAEYFRQQHADRASEAISGALDIGGLYLNDDPSALATLTAICVGHGINRPELFSSTSYPTRRDIFGEPVDVRLLSILLRLGDLLDMRSDRGCALLRSLASPLPPSSEIHWSQYQRIKSRVTSPKSIDLVAECETPEEHRLLRDWCNWIIEEVREIPRLLASSDRHASWHPPIASMGGSQDTIQIERAPDASYRLEDWKFHFDEGEVLLRLIRDVHRGKFGFIQELIQNALDSMRAHASIAGNAGGQYTNLLPMETLKQYPLRLHIESDKERVLRVDVDDSGLGMTPAIISQYFLQIGRSWYKSEEFARQYNFTATSRFGVGFLSVFSASSDVTVTTRWHQDPPDHALSMRLQGPRSYLLLEDAVRHHSGTTVSVTLTHELGLQELVNYLHRLCVAVEFPIELSVSNVGDNANIESKILSKVDSDEATSMSSSAIVTCVVRKVSIATPGAFGHFDVLVVIRNDSTEDWSLDRSALSEILREENPLATPPTLSDSWWAINGLSTSGAGSTMGDTASLISWKIDFRSPEAAGGMGLDRHPGGFFPVPSVTDALEEALHRHLAARETGVAYRRGLVDRFETLLPRWTTSLRCLRTLIGEELSLADVASNDSLKVIVKAFDLHQPLHQDPQGLDSIATYLQSEGDGSVLDLESSTFVFKHARSEITTLGVSQIEELRPGLYIATLNRLSGALQAGGRSTFEFASFENGSNIAMLKVSYSRIVFNVDHPLVVSVRELVDDHRIEVWRQLSGSHREERLAPLLRKLADLNSSETLLNYAEFIEEDQTMGAGLASVRRLPRNLGGTNAADVRK